MGNDQLLARNLEAANWAALKNIHFLHSNLAFRTPWDWNKGYQKPCERSKKNPKYPDPTKYTLKEDPSPTRLPKQGPFYVSF